MKFRLYKEFGALNSKDVFTAFEQGIRACGHEISTDHEAIPVIWSVLWQGRMLKNKNVYFDAVKKSKPVIIIEVGNLYRGKSWRISVNNINNLGYFGNESDLDQNRINRFGIQLQQFQKNRKNEILIAAQHESSLQWQEQPPMVEWINQTVNKIKQYSDRNIVVRPHPRSFLRGIVNSANIQMPKKMENTYDDFDIDYNFHCVVNFNSGPAVQAAIRGIPVLCDQSSLASPVSFSIEQIESPVIPDREEWFLKLCHTEWFIDEIIQGIPIKRIENFLIGNR